MNTFTNGDGHAKQIAGIARSVVDNARDAQIMHEMTWLRHCTPAARYAEIRNAHVKMHAARIISRIIRGSIK